MVGLSHKQLCCVCHRGIWWRPVLQLQWKWDITHGMIFLLFPRASQKKTAVGDKIALLLLLNISHNLRGAEEMDASLNCKLLMPYLKDYVGLFTFYYIRSSVSFFFTRSLTKELDPDWFYQLNFRTWEAHPSSCAYLSFYVKESCRGGICSLSQNIARSSSGSWLRTLTNTGSYWSC